MTTYNALYLELRRRLLEAGHPGAGLEARELVCFGSGRTREACYRDGPTEIAPEAEAAVRALAARCLEGEPVAYLIGQWEFYGLTLEVSPAVLIPRVDTEVLAEAAIAFVRSLGECRLLDLCAGSGCIGLAAAANAPECRALLGDLSQEALEVCRRNIRQCALAERVEAVRLDALAPPPASIGAFHCVTCNPPYISRAELETLDRSVRDYEPRLALLGGEDGYAFYRAVTRQWKGILRPGGRPYFEVGMGQAETVRRMMEAEGFRDVQALPDSRDIPRLVYGTWT